MEGAQQGLDQPASERPQNRSASPVHPDEPVTKRRRTSDQDKQEVADPAHSGGEEVPGTVAPGGSDQPHVPPGAPPITQPGSTSSPEHDLDDWLMCGAPLPDTMGLPTGLIDPGGSGLVDQSGRTSPQVPAEPEESPSPHLVLAQLPHTQTPTPNTASKDSQPSVEVPPGTQPPLSSADLLITQTGDAAPPQTSQPPGPPAKAVQTSLPSPDAVSLAAAEARANLMPTQPLPTHQTAPSTQQLASPPVVSSDDMQHAVKDTPAAVVSEPAQVPQQAISENAAAHATPVLSIAAQAAAEHAGPPAATEPPPYEHAELLASGCPPSQGNEASSPHAPDAAPAVAHSPGGVRALVPTVVYEADAVVPAGTQTVVTESVAVLTLADMGGGATSPRAGLQVVEQVVVAQTGGLTADGTGVVAVTGHAAAGEGFSQQDDFLGVGGSIDLAPPAGGSQEGEALAGRMLTPTLTPAPALAPGSSGAALRTPGEGLGFGIGSMLSGLRPLRSGAPPPSSGLLFSPRHGAPGSSFRPSAVGRQARTGAGGFLRTPGSVPGLNLITPDVRHPRPAAASATPFSPTAAARGARGTLGSRGGGVYFHPLLALTPDAPASEARALAAHVEGAQPNPAPAIGEAPRDLLLDQRVGAVLGREDEGLLAAQGLDDEGTQGAVEGEQADGSPPTEEGTLGDMSPPFLSAPGAMLSPSPPSSTTPYRAAVGRAVADVVRHVSALFGPDDDDEDDVALAPGSADVAGGGPGLAGFHPLATDFTTGGRAGGEAGSTDSSQEAEGLQHAIARLKSAQAAASEAARSEALGLEGHRVLQNVRVQGARLLDMAARDGDDTRAAAHSQAATLEALLSPPHAHLTEVQAGYESELSRLWSEYQDSYTRLSTYIQEVENIEIRMQQDHAQRMAAFREASAQRLTKAAAQVQLLSERAARMPRRLLAVCRDALAAQSAEDGAGGL